MASPECSDRATAPSPTFTDLQAALADIECQLEIADANENQIERFFKREDLLELQEWLEVEIAQAALTKLS